MTQIEMSELFDPALIIIPSILIPTMICFNFFDHWKFEFGYYLLFVFWCLELSQLKNQSTINIHKILEM